MLYRDENSCLSFRYVSIYLSLRRTGKKLPVWETDHDAKAETQRAREKGSILVDAKVLLARETADK